MVRTLSFQDKDTGSNPVGFNCWTWLNGKVADCKSVEVTRVGSIPTVRKRNSIVGSTLVFDTESTGSIPVSWIK